MKLINKDIDSYGFSSDLKQKLENSIALLKKAEPLALRTNSEGFWLAFSGGKDSQCLYHVAELSEVKFTANMNMTSIDPAEVVRFVKRNYPEVTLRAPEMNFYDLCIKKKCLPTRINRFCCDVLKERGGLGYVKLIGI